MEITRVLNLLSVFTGVFTFTALSFYFGCFVFNKVCLKFLFLTVHQGKYSLSIEVILHRLYSLLLFTVRKKKHARLTALDATNVFVQVCQEFFNMADTGGTDEKLTTNGRFRTFTMYSSSSHHCKLL